MEDKSKSNRLIRDQLIREEQGSTFVEYVIAVALFGLVMAAAVYAMGGPLMRFLVHAQLIWAGPFP